MGIGKEGIKVTAYTLLIFIVMVVTLSSDQRNKSKTFMNTFYQCERFCETQPCKQHFNEENADYGLCLLADHNCSCEKYRFWTPEKYGSMTITTFSLIVIWANYISIKVSKSRNRRVPYATQQTDTDDINNAALGSPEHRIYPSNFSIATTVVNNNISNSGLPSDNDGFVDLPPEYQPPPSYNDAVKA